MTSDEIVSDIIALIHSNTQSSYVTCSQLTSKIFSYLSEIPLEDQSWKELNSAIERFDESVDHPDLRRFRQLIETISSCSNDCEERNYTLGRDSSTLTDAIHQLRELLQSHVNLHCFLLTKLLDQHEIRLHLIDLMNLTSMNVGNDLHGLLCDIVHLLMQIDVTLAAATIIDHSIVSNCIRLIQTNARHIYSAEDRTQSTVIAALRLLTDLLLINETFPVHTSAQLSNCVFLKSIFDCIETKVDDDQLISSSIKFLLAFNLRFDYPHENPIMLTLLSVNEQISCRELIERLILLLNRSVDPIENKTSHSVIKFFEDLFGEQGTLSDILLSDADGRLIIEIISRELSNRSCVDQNTTAYLSLLEAILRHRSITSQTCPRIAELQAGFRAYLNNELCSEQNRYIINEIVRQHAWLGTNDMMFFI